MRRLSPYRIEPAPVKKREVFDEIAGIYQKNLSEYTFGAPKGNCILLPRVFLPTRFEEHYTRFFPYHFNLDTNVVTRLASWSSTDQTLVVLAGGAVALVDAPIITLLPAYALKLPEEWKDYALTET